MDIGWAGTLLLATTGAIVGAASLYLLGLALAALRPPRAAPLGGGHSRLAVIVPAHNEAELLPRCLASLRAQDYPPDRFEVLVVADNCTDSTAAVARDGGARVLVRDQPDLRGKGRALRWAMDSLLSSANPPDAVVVVDADSVADTALLRSLEGAMLAGAEAVQAEYLALGEASSGATLRQASFLLFHRTRFAGRAALGMACSLVGNGMLFTRSLLERMPWNAFTGAEDLEYSTELRLRGVRPVFTSAAGVAAPAAGFGRGAATQRMRWEGGRFHVARTRLPDLMTSAVRRRDWSLLDAAADLAVPPLGLLVMLALLGGAAGLALWVAGLTPLWVGIIWWAALLAIAGHVLIGLRAARAPASAYRALLQTPRFLVVKLGTYLRMSRGLRADRWERTERPSEAGHGVDRPNPPTGAQRLNVCGVPIDPVDRAQAVDRILASVGSGSVLQVCTVNLQFLVTARRRPEVRRALGDAGLNLADGAPVTWLARLLGRPLPG
ncbi:MAG: glycosyltransferase family 2 protein, partial [Candidatus Dormiibacterota bacterium]